MRGPTRFRGAGVRLPDHRALSWDRPIENAPFPAVCTLAMQQGANGLAECAVEVGDFVAEGMLVGRASGATSANVHSPVPGRVRAITDIRLPSGERSRAVVVELEGRFARSGKPSRVLDWRKMPVERIADRLRAHGVLGLCGESFPLPALAARPGGGRRPEILVANGVEAEPYLTGSHRLLLERTPQLLAGLRIAEKLLSPHRVVIAVDAGRAEVVEALVRSLRFAGLRYEVVALEGKYPQGQARHIVETVTGRELRYPSEPEDIGCVVAGVETLHAVYEAVVLDCPLIERVLTVSGVVARPSNLKTRIGTSVRDLIEDCGGFTETPAKVVVGGPMTGYALESLDVPVTKGVAGIVALSSRGGRPPRTTACLSCGKCIRVCPAGVSPVLLHRQIEHGRHLDAVAHGLTECTECGCCAYVCPAGIRLVESMRRGKKLASSGMAP